MAPIRYRTADVDGFKVFYREAGPADAPKLLLLHGFPSASHQFRDLIPLLADRFHIVAPDLPGFGQSDNDVRFMRMAIDEARQADFPFGAVIVRNGAVIARGRNLGRTTGDPTAHGEMVAIQRCLADHGSAALRGSTLYTSGEPCAMCMGAILWCHLGRLVFAASIAQLATKIDQIMISSADLAAKAPFAPIAITGGVLADEAMALFVK
jgi:tRNA(adenine34) deaminase